MRRLLIISPHFPPVNAPDMQRVRMSLPYFAEQGWETRVICSEPDEESQRIEPELLETIPGNVQIIRVRPFPLRITRKIGLGNIGWRSLTAIAKAAEQLFPDWRPDLVYFSTTQFSSLLLGPRWRRRHGLPYVIDLQDPWVTDFYSQPGAPKPPGGWKYGISRRLSGWMEKRCMRQAAGVISVSPAYLEALSHRYPWFESQLETTVLPFGVSTLDLAKCQKESNPADANTIVYTGRLGGDMLQNLDFLFTQVSRLRKTGNVVPRFKFVGTSYAPGAKAVGSTLEIALRHDIADLVSETVERIPYFDAMRLQQSAGALLILGSTDQDYSPSKIYPVLAAQRPTLVITSRNSILDRVISKMNCGARLVYPDSGNDGAVSLSQFLMQIVQTSAPAVQFSPDSHQYDAQSLTTRQCRFFERCLSKE